MTNETNYYKELSLFNNIKDPGHKAWNRLITIANLKEDGRERDAAGYLDKLNPADKASLGLILQKIRMTSYEQVRREINKGLDIEATNHS